MNQMPNPYIIKYRIASSALIEPLQKIDRSLAEECFLYFAGFSHATLLGMDWCGTWIVLADSWPPKKP